MSDVTPPPVPPPTQGGPSVPPPPVDMKTRWIMWVLASVVLPALPWLTAIGGSNSLQSTAIPILTLLALVLQLAASIAVALGFCKRRSIGAGGAIGMTLVFMLASVAIGTAVWFAVCVAFVSVDMR